MNGTCRRCYEFEALVLNAEEAVLMVIPRLIYNARLSANRTKRAQIRRKRALMNIARDVSLTSLSPSERLRLLLRETQ